MPGYYINRCARAREEYFLSGNGIIMPKRDEDGNTDGSEKRSAEREI